MPKRISSIKPRENIRRGQRQQKNSKRWYTSLFVQLVIISILICVAVNIRIYYNQRTELLNREVVKLGYQIHEIDREIENLKKRKEELCSFSNVAKRIREEKLGLRYATPQQIRRTVLVRRDSEGFNLAAQHPKNSSTPKTAAVR